MLFKKKSEVDFVALTVHRLKTPLSSIRLSLEMLLEGDFGDLSPEQKKIIGRTKQRGDIALEIVEQLIGVANMHGKEIYKLSDVDFESLINEIIDCDQESIKKKGINLRIEKSQKKLPVFKFDKEKIFWAIQNIIDNAIKYSHVGGDILVSYKLVGKKLELQIKDNGIGIKDSEKEKIFEEFFRGENAKEADSTGSGLGLFISKNVIEWHKGRIYFDSKEGKGTTFFIELPLPSGK